MRRIAVTLVLLLAAPAAWADANAVYRCGSAQYDAVGACTTVIQSGAVKDKVTAYENRGEAYARGGRPNDALADFSQAIALDPGAVLAYGNRGMVEADQAQNDKAIADFTEALKLGAGGAEQMDVLNARAAVYAGEGRIDAAEADYKAALALAPNDTVATEGLAHVESGRRLTLGLEAGGAVIVLLAVVIAVVFLRRRRSR